MQNSDSIRLDFMLSELRRLQGYCCIAQPALCSRGGGKATKLFPLQESTLYHILNTKS